jgi:DNA-binding CsgD family transcriptional regulator
MRSESRLKSSGIFFGSIFLAGAAMNAVTGLAAGETVSGLLSDFIWVDSLIFAGIALFASAYAARLAWVQPLLFLVVTPVNVLSARDSFYGLAFYSVATLLLIKLDFFNRRRVLRSVGCLAYLIAVEVACALRNKEPLIVSIQPVFFIVAFIAFLLLTFRDRIFVYLKEPKPIFSLEKKGLSVAEQIYVRAMLAGKGVKGVALETGVSESTVRNTLARAYKKLAVGNRSGLLSLAQKYTVK